eukprot:TRINITY_DN24494_c0_g1_i1.p1 TRINITY_DN24494_c0_g1~~TRINITY_DN24494_c0_g1_i1.p1  ORF type:complete len:445 (-),score=25.60 TRINITY_DN24494_c0_g1_i1:82-1416(-)
MAVVVVFSMFLTLPRTLGQVEVCAQATTPCACAGAKICGWLASASEASRCVHLSNQLCAENASCAGTIDCDLCSAQNHCVPNKCQTQGTPCGCADDSGCRWDATSGCVQRFGEGTPCSHCPTQGHCQVTAPEVVTFRPANRSLHPGGADLNVSLLFNKAVDWCDTTNVHGDDITFWCFDIGQMYKVNRSSIKFTANSMMISLSSYLYLVDWHPARMCGLTIEASRICDSSGVAFGGLAHGSYSLQLLDEQRPVLQDIRPHNDAIMPLDGWVVLKWSEAVQLNPREPDAIVHELKIRADGHAVRHQTATIALRAPHAEIVSGRILRLHLRGKLKPGGIHSLQFPEGVVHDMSGNPCNDLPPQAYRFRAAPLNSSAGASAASNADLVHDAAYDSNYFSSTVPSTSEEPQSPKTSLSPQGVQTMASKTALATRVLFLRCFLVSFFAC